MVYDQIQFPISDFKKNFLESKRLQSFQIQSKKVQCNIRRYIISFQVFILYYRGYRGQNIFPLSYCAFNFNLF